MSKSKKKAVPMGKIKPITASIPKPLSNKQEISLCLVMIVKDEEDTIAKCLKAVAPYISYYVIVDTGSKDNTLKKIIDNCINIIKDSMCNGLIKKLKIFDK